MRGTSRWFVVASAMTMLGACGAGDTRVDPGDLELRDLLGIAPDVASAWDPDQRAAARRVLVAGFEENADPATVTASAATVDDRVVRGLAVLDLDRDRGGAGALGVVRVVMHPAELTASARAADRAIGAARGTPTAVTELWLADSWDAQRAWGQLPGRGLDLLSAMAVDAGHTTGPVIVVPAPRLAAIAGYVAGSGGTPARLVVNPIVLAALEPETLEAATTAMLERAPGSGVSASARLAQRNPGAAPPAVVPPSLAGPGGNPYSFFGSISECAYAQRTRCTSCLSASNCAPVTDATDGNAECTTLGENSGRGYFLLCVNLALAITSVETCSADAAPGCPRDASAASSLGAIENNASFVDDSTCGGALDTCLATIYGAGGEFPGPGPDGGIEPVTPPRSTSVDCGDSCSSDSNRNCEASPSCDCSGPSCNNSLSCDSACANSNDQSGCGGNCDSCSSDSGGGGGGCSSDSSSGGSSSGGGCGGGGGGGSCGGGDCGGGGCGGGGGNSSCTVAKRDPGEGGTALVVSVIWAFLPVPIAAVIRRRSRRKRADVGDDVSGEDAP